MIDTNNSVYVGSTLRSFLQRFGEHYGRLTKQNHRCKKLQDLFDKSTKKELKIHALEVFDDPFKGQCEIHLREMYWANYFKVKKASKLLLNKRMQCPSIFLKEISVNKSHSICKIENIINHKKYISAHSDLCFFQSTQTSKLLNGLHHNSLLQQDFDIFGMQNFIFEEIKKTDSVHFLKDFLFHKKRNTK